MSVLIIVCFYSYVTNISETCFVCCEGPPKPIGKQKMKGGLKSSLFSWCWPIPLWDAVENKAGSNMLGWSPGSELGAPASIPLSCYFQLLPSQALVWKHMLLMLALLAFQILPWDHGLRILFLLVVLK